MVEIATWDVIVLPQIPVLCHQVFHFDHVTSGLAYRLIKVFSGPHVH